MKKAFIIFLTSILLFTIKAQDADEIYAFQSPEVASLGFVSNIPVDLHVGRGNTSIPLFNPDYFKYPLSVSLNYNSDGFMPGVQNSWVGQNWSLQAGGVITRVVKGLPDETYNFGLFYSYEAFLNYDADFYAAAQAARQVDTEPDEFHFSVNGISGTFYLNKDRTFTVFGDPGIKVEYDEGSMKSIYSLHTGKYTDKTFSYFKITDTEGNQYYFGNYKETSNKYIELSTSPSQKNCVATTWNLNCIVLREDWQQIKFTYSDIVMDINVSQTEKRTINPDQGGPYDPVRPCEMNPQSVITGVNYIEHSYLKTIECIYFPEKVHWKMDFHTSEINYRNFPAERYYTGNKLSPCWQKLDSITLMSINPAERIKSVKFEYAEQSPIRLFLSSVKESDKPAYQFDYYDHHSAKSVTFDTKETDHWGFYTGFGKWTEENYSRIPQELPEKYQVSGFRYYPHRETNPEVASVGMLKTIQHPTGAITDFIYEPNTYSSFIDYPLGSALPIKVSKRWSEFKGKTFAVYPDSIMYHDSKAPTLTLDNPAYVIITINAPYATGHDKKVRHLLDAGEHNLLGFFIAEILDNDWPANTMYSCACVYKEIILSENAYAGGVRIKQITQKDKEGDEIIKEYDYTSNSVESTSTTTSSGILGSYPYYICSYLTQLNPPFVSVLAVFKSTTKNAQEYTKGRPLGYSTVTEMTKSSTGDILGYNQCTYTNFDRFPDIAPVTGTNRPDVHNDFNAKTRLDYARGNLLSESIYDSDKKIIKKSLYRYDEYIFHPELKGVFMLFIQEDLMPCTEQINCYNIMEYQILNATHNLANMKVYEYVDDQIIETTTVYEYNPVYNFMFEERIHANNVIKISYTYPFDYTTQPFTDMVNKNIISRVVEKTTTKDEKVISSLKTDYYGSENLFLPRKVQHSTNKVNYYDVRTYDAYDPDGQVIQYTDKDNIPNVIIWSYSYQYPAFEIKNITLEQLKAAIGTNLFDEMYYSVYISDNRMVEITRELRQKLPDHLITTAVYKPLVGMKSITDARGITTYHGYDEAGRLKETYIIEDGEKKILQAYDYHYRE